MPDAQAREEDGKRPNPNTFLEMGKLNIIAMRLGPGPHLKGRTLMGGIVQPEEFDYFHELIMGQEIARAHSRGYQDGSGGGTYIGELHITVFSVVISLLPFLQVCRPS